MVDLHSHILPVDDGAKDWEESLAMVKQAARDGIQTIVVTPHHKKDTYVVDPVDIMAKVTLLNERIKEEGLEVTILPGSEIQVYEDYVIDLKKGNLLTINDHKYVFLEFPYDRVPVGAEQLVFEIQLAGYIPIIPHPERNREIRENPIKIYQLVKKGALTQITAASLLGKFGKEVQKFTLELIDGNLTHFLATDAHSSRGHRGVMLKAGYQALEDFAGENLVEQFKQNARAVIEGKDIYVDMPEKIMKKKRILGLF
ncbi:hypothetical protein BHF71_01060 [Vulcanibacillus modesticaldus]|uniref:Tyrosine-protein phosphatase n=1 Tax=Vulcanibacillus modesticaldus TaxID=337097 RepID=A0A1D2YVZ7_9BACI|nr:CpsB/CapC family capsule biosynthesis tyrosine phosphatase [Vulcanibacillus modesticaldus]OEF99795.1 hypothetical protein BHF71_01060 [Vulcanibacillus modesticaldus]